MTTTHLAPTDALVSVIMGSQSDWETMQEACKILESSINSSID